jgi:hypothetical protein
VTYAIFQAFVITAILSWSVWFAVRKFFPRAYRGALVQVAERLTHSSHARGREFGARLMPQQVSGGGGCDSGGACSSCGACAPVSAPRADVQPLVFQPRAKS